MKFYRTKTDIWNHFDKALIHSVIAPFGFSMPYNNWKFDSEARIITQPDQEYVTKTLQYNCKVKTIPRVHAKLAVGLYGVLFGSFNFTNSKQKELVAYSEKPEDIEDALNEFERWWENARQ